MSNRPVALPINPDSIPEELRLLPTWCCWRYHWLPTQGRWSKLPISPASGRAMDCDQGEGLAPFEAALATYKAMRLAPEASRLDGVGLALRGTGYVALDLDHCVDETGTLADHAAELVRVCKSYAELSPSGRGLRIMVHGQIPPGRRKIREPVAIEFFDSNYVTVTGTPVGEAATVRECQRLLDKLYGGLFGRQEEAPQGSVVQAASQILTDEQILTKARAAKNGELFERLWQGEWQDRFPSQSEADLALVALLAFWSQGEPASIDRLFRQSALYRPKWDQDAYRQRTISRAIANCPSFYSPNRTEVVVSRPEPPQEEDDDPFRLAWAFLRRFRHPEGHTLVSWRDEWYVWASGAYRVVPKSELEARLYQSIRQEYECDVQEKLALLAPNDPRRQGLTVDKVTLAAMHNAVQALASQVTLPGKIEPPCWLGDKALSPATELLVCPNALVHLPSVVAGKPAFQPPTPRFFSLTALDFDFNQNAPEPGEWLQFLQALWPEDQGTVDVLQEWFGYCVAQDTKQHKMLLLVGPKRGGKGTIAAILSRLVGLENVAGPTLASFNSNFGLWPLLGKTLAIVDDARLSGRSDSAVVAERLLSISGEGLLQIDRKYLPPLTAKLSARIMLLTNELPWLPDNSGVLPSRFIVLRMTESWYGKEDTKLLDRLLPELPGILLWAIEGWKRLRERGHFVQPGTGQEFLEQMEDVSSPVSHFVRERCAVEAGARATTDDLWEAWQRWCGEERRDPGSRSVFFKTLRAVVPRLKKVQPREYHIRWRGYEGLKVVRATDV